jgi:hypothetical protein
VFGLVRAGFGVIIRVRPRADGRWSVSGFVCDRCGKALLVDEDVRYILKMEVYAAYDPMELTAADLGPDRRKELAELVEKMKEMDAGEVQDSIHKEMVFDLCPGCQREMLKDPLGRHS